MFSYFKITLSATVVALSALAGACGREFVPPTDDEMIGNFTAHENEFNEMAAILREHPLDSLPRRYPPFDIYALEDSSYIAALGEANCVRLDSLLKRVNCECVQVYHSMTSDPVGYSFRYYCDGTSVGTSVFKDYVYIIDGEAAAKAEKSLISHDPGDSVVVVDLKAGSYLVPGDSVFLADSETNAYRDLARNNPDVNSISIRRHIKGCWIISFDYLK